MSESPGGSQSSSGRKSGRPSRKSVPPTDPNVGKDEIWAAARRWVADSVVAASREAGIPKTEFFDRYFSTVGAAGAVNDSTLGKIVAEIWAAPSRRLGPRGDNHPNYVGIKWKEEEGLTGPAADPPVDQQGQSATSSAPVSIVDGQQSRQVPVTPSAPDWGPKLSALRASIPTLRRVPAGARIEVARALTDLIKEVVESNTDVSWAKLFFFPYAALPVPGKEEKVKNLTKWVKGRLGVATTSPFPQAPRRPPRRAVAAGAAKNFDASKKVEAKLADGDVRGAIRLLTSDDTIAPNNDATKASLLEKHPRHPEPTDFPLEEEEETTPTGVVLESGDVAKAVKSFPPGSAGGLDALRPQILKDLIAPSVGDAATSLLEALTSFISLVLAGKVPSSFCPIFYGASLTALRKKCGGIRPVAVGNTWRRLAAKIVCARTTPTLASRFSPHQLGVGVRGGAEAGAHAARTYFTARHKTAKAFLKVDFRNAFNEIRRDNLLRAVKQSLPQFYAFVSQAYRSPSSLFWGATPISSELGVQQGDPLGPALFALVLQPVVEAIGTEFNLWYLDDGTVGDDPDKVIGALTTIIALSGEVGLTLNFKKCEVAVLGVGSEEAEGFFAKFEGVAPGIARIPHSSATLLGSPLTEDAIEGIVKGKTSKLADTADRLNSLTAHSAFFLLRASISIPRLIYFLRCAPCWKGTAHLLEYDKVLKSALERILNCALSDRGWLQSSLPVRMGGLGIRHAVDAAIPCFLASLHSVLPLVKALLPADILGADSTLEEAFDLWKERGVFLPPPEEKMGIQEEWETPLHELTQSTLRVTATTPTDQARILAAGNFHAGAWLHALPSPQLGTHLSDESFRIACALRLGADTCVAHRCPCGADVSSLGLHGLACKRSKGRWSRHGAVNDIIARALQSGGVPNIKEPAGCSRADGKRPDGLTLVPWSRGRPLVWDFTCTDTFAPSYVAASATRRGSAAEGASEGKVKKYEYLGGAYIFAPIAVETSGVWAMEAVRFILELGRRIAEVSGEKRSTCFLLQRLSIAVQRGNVAAVLGTLPAGKELDEIFIL